VAREPGTQRNADRRNQWLGFCSWVPGLGPDGPSRKTPEFRSTARAVKCEHLRHCKIEERVHGFFGDAAKMQAGESAPLDLRYRRARFLKILDSKCQDIIKF
jgi:hypothetical protein